VENYCANLVASANRLNIAQLACHLIFAYDTDFLLGTFVQAKVARFVCSGFTLVKLRIFMLFKCFLVIVESFGSHMLPGNKGPCDYRTLLQ
jgi:hypothetical protein